VSGKGSPLIADVYTIDHNRQISMKKASDGANTHDLIGSAVRALDPIFTAANIGSEFASSQLLTERASAQLAMAAIEALGSTYSATIAAASAAIRDALKPSLAMQAVLDSIRPIKDMHKQLFAGSNNFLPASGTGRRANSSWPSRQRDGLRSVPSQHLRIGGHQVDS